MSAYSGLEGLPTPARSRDAAPTRVSARPWIDRWLETCRDLAELKASHPMMDAVIDEIDGRMIRIGDHWLADFASCNYLAFDLDREIIDAIPAYLDAWGTRPSWSCLLGSPVIYEEIEARLTGLLGAEDALVLPTITHIHMLFDRWVYATLAAHPLVPKDEVGFRVQLIAANTDAEVDLLLAAVFEASA
jgi:7-keto-8-aminopelargonate synthetase-like enzyme